MLIVSIAGGSGSGKTTFAKKVQKYTSKKISILHMDSYYLNNIPADLYTSKGHPNFDHPEAFDWELLTDHLTKLKNGTSINVPVYDYTTHSRLNDTILLDANEIIILEGIFTLHNSAIRELADIKCFLNVESDIRFIRRLHRDIKDRGRTMDNVVEQYYETVRPMYKKFLEPQQQYADFIIGEETTVAASILAARLNQQLDITKQSNHSISDEITEALQ